MNMLLVFVLMVCALGFVLLMQRQSLSHTYVALVVLYLVTTLTAGKIIMLDFGLFSVPASCAAPLYGAIFLVTDIISERHGKKQALRAVWLGLFSVIALCLFGLIIRAISAAEGDVLAEALSVIFGFTPRLVVGSLIAYVIAQHVDVWIFEKLKNMHGDRLLWLRNNCSTLVSQFIDSLVVFSIAFIGVIDNWVVVMFSTYVIKVVVALCDTPWLYFARRYGPREESVERGENA
ncbi:MAG: hypothetical protein CML13_06875 [Puniceicoccaceae bacterium]|nr:hypothetical protein [Puniceicoccaceae bacterium]|tara:strand:- start:5091 stop:5792 length:702 start_codon:yes stop_codon:yes gene_type:complete